MSKIIVDEIQTNTVNGNVRIIPNGTGELEVTGNCSATTFSGSGANLTNVPAPSTYNAANLTGTIPNASIPDPLPAINGSALTGVGGGGFDFVKKITTSSSVSYIDETGLDYDKLYRFVFKKFSLSSADELYVHPMVDNETTPVNRYGCQNVTSAYGGSNYQRGGNHDWQFYNGSYWYPKMSGYFDLYTTDQAWIIGNLNSYPSMYGYCFLWGDYGLTANTNNDSNQTGTYAKVNGFRLQAGSQAQTIGTDLEILVYKYKES